MWMPSLLSINATPANATPADAATATATATVTAISLASDGGATPIEVGGEGPSLCLSFVRTRRIAGGGIAEHGDLPLSHR